MLTTITPLVTHIYPAGNLKPHPHIVHLIPLRKLTKTSYNNSSRTPLNLRKVCSSTPIALGESLTYNYA
jgi:hypothetical protein